MTEQNKQQAPQEPVLPTEPCHVMTREYYERMAREAAEQK